VRDLLFASRITATARAIGVDVRIVREVNNISAISARKLLVDLNQEGFLEAAARWKSQTGGVAIGFVSHVDTATISRAKEAGIDQVLPRSQFVNRLVDLLR
jgi:hypothetical protein